MSKLGVQLADKADCFSPAGSLLPCQKCNPFTETFPCLGRQRREKIGKRILNAMKSFKNHEVRQRKGGSGRGGSRPRAKALTSVIT